MKYWIIKWHKAIAAILAFLINSVGLVLSFLGLYSDSKFGESKLFITIILCAAELFLIAAAIYSIISMMKDTHNRVSVHEKEAEIIRYRDAGKTIFENSKASVAYYKDFKDRLSILLSGHLDKLNEIRKLATIIATGEVEPGPTKSSLEKYVEDSKITAHKELKYEMIDLYSRFSINMINLVQESIEEYLRTKGCKKQVSIAFKQLNMPTKYKEIDDKKTNIYTAFRDQKTYHSKTRNETWKKSFCIRKNSDFVFSIERDYYIFNFVSRLLSENGLYLNENTNFYEHYNSGVTCTIHSCKEKERVLYGFLACDSLFDEKDKKNLGTNIYDYNVANILMSTAHIMALFFDEFLEKWDNYVKACGTAEDDLCQVMINRVNSSRYHG